MPEFCQAYCHLVRLIREAAYSSDAVDYFNLHGNDATMWAAWSWLLKEHHDTFLAVVKHIQNHGDELIAAIGDAPPDAPTEPPPAMLGATGLADYVYTALTHYAVTAERATRDPTKTIPDATKLPLPGKWQRNGDIAVMRTIIPKDT